MNIKIPKKIFLFTLIVAQLMVGCMLSLSACSDNTHTHIYNTDDNICTICGEKKPSEGLNYVLNDDKVSYSLWGIGTCTDTEIVVASTYEGKPVTNIRGLSDLDTITSIAIPNGVKSISSGAFSHCGNLISVEIGDSVEDIGEYAFSGCVNLSDITIPKNLNTFGSNVFSECKNITFTEYDNAIYFGDDDNPFAILISAQDKDIAACNIHQNAKVIAGFAFAYCSRMCGITIPDGVRGIGRHAFGYCSALEDLTIGNNVEVIDDDAFSGCRALQEIVIPSSVKQIKDHAFHGCLSVERVTLGEGLIYIGESAFSIGSTLKSVEFKNTKGWTTYGIQRKTISSADLADSEKAASYLGYHYCTCRWERR